MNEKEYISERLEDQIKWYSDKSVAAQKRYKIFQCIEIIIAGAISVLTLCGIKYSSIVFPILVSSFGACIIAIEAICKMYNFHENWIQYRHVSEILKHEKYLYLTKTSPYDDEDAFSILVQRTERAISSENINWVGINTDDKSN